jgi:hypothetical protein
MSNGTSAILTVDGATTGVAATVNQTGEGKGIYLNRSNATSSLAAAHIVSSSNNATAYALQLSSPNATTAYFENTGGNYALKAAGNVQTTQFIEALDGVNSVFQAGNNLNHTTSGAIDGIVVGNASVPENSMIFNANTGEFVLGPSGTKFVSAMPRSNGDNEPNFRISSAGTGVNAAPTANLVDIISNSADLASIGLYVQGLTASTVPIAKIERTTTGNASAMEVNLTAANADASTYALETFANSATAGGALYAEVNNSGATAAEFKNSVTAGNAVKITEGSLYLEAGARLKGQVVDAANNGAINGDNLVFRYTGGANTLNKTNFTAATDGTIIYVYSADAQATYDGTNSLNAGEAAVFIYYNGAWRTVR